MVSSLIVKMNSTNGLQPKSGTKASDFSQKIQVSLLILTSFLRINLHVVFTMNPASPDFHNRAATSPALFNRCVLDWFGEWSDDALFQVGGDFTRNLDLDEPTYKAPEFVPEIGTLTIPEPFTSR